MTEVTNERADARKPSREERSTGRRWWIVAVLALGGVAGVIVALSGRSDAPPTIDPRTALTHPITRGDLLVTITEQGTLESSDNTEIKCKVRGQNTVTWVIESGSIVEPGDELVRLDTLFIEEQINERSKYAHWSRSGAEHWKANVARAELAIPEYLEGRYVTQMMTLEKDLAIAKSNLTTARNMLDHARMMHERGYRSAIDVEEREFAVKQAELDVSVKETEISVLRDYTKAMELETLRGNLNSARAEFSASDERAEADAARRDRALEELKHCVVRAKRGGMVIYPSAAAWERTPDIEEGATVHKDQVLLLMPDLSKMQVRLGVHESIVDRVRPGLRARVALPDRILDAEVSTVSSIARPAGWWTGNAVKYDTIVQLPSIDGLKPGMSAEVEIVLATYDDVLTIPVAAVLETADGEFCWVRSDEITEKRPLRLGDTNDMFVVVEGGLAEGEEVVLNPLAFVPEAQAAALEPLGDESPDDSSELAPTDAKSGRAASARSDRPDRAP